MGVQDVVLFVEARAEASSALAMAAHFAAAAGARVTGVCRPVDPVLPVCDGFAIGADAVGQVLGDRRRLMREALAPAEQAFWRAFATGPAAPVWIVARPEKTVEELAALARVADLVVVKRPDKPERELLRLAEAVVLDGSAPCLLVPESAAPPGRFARIVVAWDGGRAAARAARDAMAVLEAGAAVEVVTIGSVAFPCQSVSDMALADHLIRHGFRAARRRIEPDGQGEGRALLGHCRDIEADLLVMGGYDHGRAAEQLLGGLTRTILREASLPVLMSR